MQFVRNRNARTLRRHPSKDTPSASRFERAARRRLPVSWLAAAGSRDPGGLSARARGLLLRACEPTGLLALALLTACGCQARPDSRRVLLAPPATVAPPSAPATPTPSVAVIPLPAPADSFHDVASAAPPTAPPPVLSESVAPSPCAPLSIDPRNGLPRSSPQVYAAARRYFLAHTAPGSRYALGPELIKERSTLRFTNTDRRETGQVMQATVDQIMTRYPGSLVAPAKRPLRAKDCYDEVYLDLTEDGSYWVIVETDTALPVFMYWRQYRP